MDFNPSPACLRSLAASLLLFSFLYYNTKMSNASSSTTHWQRLWEEAQPRLGNIRQSLTDQTPPAPRISRVGKLDAELLDQELVTVLQEPVGKALSLINVSVPRFRKCQVLAYVCIRTVYVQGPLRTRVNSPYSIDTLQVLSLGLWRKLRCKATRLEVRARLQLDKSFFESVFTCLFFPPHN